MEENREHHDTHRTQGNNTEGVEEKLLLKVVVGLAQTL
jgi:hypothetical protein